LLLLELLLELYQLLLLLLAERKELLLLLLDGLEDLLLLLKVLVDGRHNRRVLESQNL